MNRTSAINRLLLGRVLGAEVNASTADHRAWIHVEPVIDPNLGRMVSQSHNEGEHSLETFQSGSHPVNKFNVRLRELHKDFEDMPDDWDLIGLNVDEVECLDSIDLVEEYLQKRFEINWVDLQLPQDLDAPF